MFVIHKERKLNMSKKKYYAVKARGANIIGLGYHGEELDKSVFDYEIRIPQISDIVAPVLAVVALQLLAYYTAKEKGCDIDKPRNLAKSVTVE